MNGLTTGLPFARRAIARLCWLSVILAAGPTVEAQEAEPLARYLPGDGLSILVEHDGFDSRPAAWKGTAAYKMLNETTLGSMIEDIATQLIDRAIRGLPQGAPVDGKEVVGLIIHLASKGFAIGYCGSLNPPDPRAVGLVIRDAAKNPTFKKVIAQVPPLSEPAAEKVEAPGGRKVLQAQGIPVRWWYEKDDFVLSFAPPGAPDPIMDVLEGKTPNALKNPTRAALVQPERGDLTIGLFFVDLAALPPLPPKAGEFGLDAIKRVDGRLAILKEDIVTSLGIQAPRPRKGILAFFDQPPIGASGGIELPNGATDFALLSVDTKKTGDLFLAMLKKNDADSAARLIQFAETFRNRTGLSLRNDLIDKLGPRMAVLGPQGGAIGNLFGMWLAPPEFGLVAEVRDSKGFASALDRLMEVANRELKAAGAMVRPQPGQVVRPGTEFAEFRRLKAPDQGYVLAIPPSVLPSPAGLRPTVLIDPTRGVVAFGTSPASARRLLGTLLLTVGHAGPYKETGRIALAESDQKGTLPSLLANLPSIVQFAAFSASQPNPQNPRPAGPPFRLQVDPDTIPDARKLASYLFPSKFTIDSDDSAIRMTLDQAFPLPVPQLNAGMEAPVLIALLLPAVQAAREAARRSQCVNNLKQIGLAMHNYESANGNLPPAAIVDKQGKPLLSWRVAILPYIEQAPLYNKFKLDEPWDSPNNRELIRYMPNIYACPSSPPGIEAGQTPYQVFSGPGALFDRGTPTKFAGVFDGLSNTLMAAEASKAVTWTRPDDLPFDQAPGFQPERLFGLSSLHPGGFNVLMADGSVRFIKVTVNPIVLKALITKAGGEIIANDAF